MEFRDLLLYRNHIIPDIKIHIFSNTVKTEDAKKQAHENFGHS